MVEVLSAETLDFGYELAAKFGAGCCGLANGVRLPICVYTFSHCSYLAFRQRCAAILRGVHAATVKPSDRIHS